MLDPVNIGIYRGTTYTTTITWRDAAGAFVNLTGATSTLQAKYYYGGPIVIESNTATGGIVLDNIAHTVTITITPAQTIAISNVTAPVPLLYDALLVLANGTSYKIVEGTLTVYPTVVGLSLTN